MLGGSILEGLGKVLKGGERAWSRAVELGRAAHAGEATLYGERAGSKFIGQAEAKEIRMANAARDVERVRAPKGVRAARKAAGPGVGRRMLDRIGRVRNRASMGVVSGRARAAEGVEAVGSRVSGLGNAARNRTSEHVALEKAEASINRARRSAKKAVREAKTLSGGEQVSGVVHTPPPKSKAGFGRSGKAATRKQLDSANSMTSDTRFGRGLATMRRHKIKSTLVAGAGLGVAAKVRSTGSGTSRGNTSFYSH